MDDLNIDGSSSIQADADERANSGLPTERSTPAVPHFSHSRHVRPGATSQHLHRLTASAAGVRSPERSIPSHYPIPGNISSHRTLSQTRVPSPQTLAKTNSRHRSSEAFQQDVNTYQGVTSSAPLRPTNLGDPDGAEASRQPPETYSISILKHEQLLGATESQLTQERNLREQTQHRLDAVLREQFNWKAALQKEKQQVEALRLELKRANDDRGKLNQKVHQLKDFSPASGMSSNDSIELAELQKHVEKREKELTDLKQLLVEQTECIARMKRLVIEKFKRPSSTQGAYSSSDSQNADPHAFFGLRTPTRAMAPMDNWSDDNSSDRTLGSDRSTSSSDLNLSGELSRGSDKTRLSSGSITPQNSAHSTFHAEPHNDYESHQIEEPGYDIDVHARPLDRLPVENADIESEGAVGGIPDDPFYRSIPDGGERLSRQPSSSSPEGFSDFPSSGDRQCHVCGKYFPDSEIQEHLLECLDRSDFATNDSDLNTIQPNPKSKSRACPMCGAGFPDDVPQQDYELHVVSHFDGDGDLGGSP